MNLIEFIQPGLIVLVPVLYLLGIALKKSQSVKDNHIPLILGAAGILVAAFAVFAEADIQSAQDALTAVFSAITQGILCAGCSVYVNQVLIKQPHKTEKKNDGGNESCKN